MHTPPSGLNLTAAMTSANEVGLDPNDFPALGSTPANPNPGGSNTGSGTGATTSYASQAGTGVLVGSSGGLGTAVGNSATAAQTRDFTPDDFPALGGQSQPLQQTRDSLQNQLLNQETLSHPPGLNGFQPSDQQQLRQTLLGAHGTGLQQGTPGMLNLGPTQSRNVHPGFQQGQSEAEKQQQRVRFLISQLFGYFYWNFSTFPTTFPPIDIPFLLSEVTLIVPCHRIIIQ